ncbi:MAG: PilT protein domain protein [Caulobacteraceae bacterium]|nr:PilT protein domain protein [Caulobacteraceae bacterium]
MSFYLDASVIVPILVDEVASAVVERFLREAADPLVVGDFAAMEVASAMSRPVRMKSLPSEVAVVRLGEFDAWRSAETSSLDLQPADLRLSGVFVRRFDLGLRAPDALHAAVCRRGDHTLVTPDKRLAAAAEALGVRVECLV